MFSFSAIIKPAAVFFLFLSAVSAHAQDKQLAQENYIQAYLNKDGVLDNDEFAKFIDLNAADNLGRANLVSSGGLYALAFERIDANGDGSVTPKELRDSSQ